MQRGPLRRCSLHYCRSVASLGTPRQKRNVSIERFPRAKKLLLLAALLETLESRAERVDSIDRSLIARGLRFGPPHVRRTHGAVLFSRGQVGHLRIKIRRTLAARRVLCKLATTKRETRLQVAWLEYQGDNVRLVSMSGDRMLSGPTRCRDTNLRFTLESDSRDASVDLCSSCC